MASLGTSHVHTPAEVLQYSQGSSTAHIVGNMKFATHCFGSWNARALCSMFDTEGPVAVSSVCVWGGDVSQSCSTTPSHSTTILSSIWVSHG